MKHHFLKKTVVTAILGATLCCSTACGLRGGQENTDAEGQEGGTDTNADLQGNNKTNDGTDSLYYDGADLAGTVMEFSESGFTISPETVTEVDGGILSEEAAPGHEDETKFISVVYTENTTFQIVTFDRERQAEVSRVETDKESIKKQTSVLIFGEKQDEKHWTAEKVTIMRWQ